MREASFLLLYEDGCEHDEFHRQAARVGSHSDKISLRRVSLRSPELLDGTDGNWHSR